MYTNTGPGTSNANSHVRHLQTNFSCENCHFTTIKTDDGTCVDCHIEGQDPIGSMDEVGHVDPAFHVNKAKDVVFKDGGTYDPVTKSCAGTSCHSGAYEDPVVITSYSIHYTKLYDEGKGCRLRQRNC